MKIIFLACFFLVSCQFFNTSNKTETTSFNFIKHNNSKKINSIAFASCFDQDSPAPIWAQIVKNNPDLMIMMGDNIYASHTSQKPIENQYNKLNHHPDFVQAKKHLAFLATWDDHDYGQNDGGTSNPEKIQARQDFINYWDYLKEQLPKTKEPKAIYHSFISGPEKSKVHIILLDTRWDRSGLKKNPDLLSAKRPIAPIIYVEDPDKNKKILSEEQWTWLENELKKSTEIKLLVSSIQVVAEDHGFEKWSNFPHEKNRLYELIKKTKPKNLFIVSGDRHLAAIAKENIAGWGTIYDITSSAINRPSRPTAVLTGSHYIQDAYGPINFGVLSVNWLEKSILFEVRSDQNTTVMNLKLPLKI